MSEPSRLQDTRKQGHWRKAGKLAAGALFDPPIQTRLFFRGIFLLLFVMTFLRLIFLLVNRGAFSGIGAAKLSLSFLNGLRFDLHMLLILFGLFFLFLHIPGRWKDQFPWVRHILWIPLALFLPAVGLILFDVHYYADAGRHLSYEIFTVHSDRYDIVSTAGMASKYGWTILFFAVLSAFLLFGWKKILGKAPGGTKPAGISPARKTLWMAFFLVFLLLGLRGTIKGRPLRMSDAFTQGRTELGHLALNPLFTVWQSVLEEGREVTSFLPGDKAVENVRRLLGTPQTVWYGDETPLYRKKAVAEGSARKQVNVVFLTMESWSPRYLGAYGDDEGTTPEFDKLAADGLLFENFYAVGNRTIEGLGAINLGIPGFNRSRGPTAGSFLSGSLEQNNYRGIGHILADAGYTSVYMHGESSSNFRHESLPTLAGFDKHLGRDELGLTPEDTSGPWGGWDHVLLDRLYDVARSEPEPFFTLWLSLTNHSP
ncbi:MAG: sulfatase-like hydrolase/transferase, partial [Thermovirgaceae bacterium]|nr:sulfatase-like hydrolase/transferase [Thermovirgaceae bacterium]